MDEQSRPLLGAAVYNPHLLSKEELVGLFHARRPLLDRLVGDLRSTPVKRPPQHHLVVGQRGMGKTMLLHRLAYAIEDDAELSESWIPLTFPEEQYNVAHLSDFWLNCLDALSDRLERAGRRDEANDLDDRIEALRKSPQKDRSRETLAALVDVARRLERRLALLVDNVDLIFDRITGKEEWALRDALSHEPGLAFFGASAAAGEATYDHGRAFYEFFQVHELDGLSLDGTRQLLVHYAEEWDEPEVAEIAERHHARLRTLHTLTGGNPRTIVLLFNVLARGMSDDVRTDLEHLLDQCTPLYKARFEALPEQAQRVVHALAIHWDPISAGELAREMGLKVNLVSAQLNRLVQQGVVEKVPYHPATKIGFQIAERFFNIWYLMRASRRVRRKLVWLVEFLRLCYSQEELEERAREHVAADVIRETDRLAHAEMAFALAEALPSGIWRWAMESVGLRGLIESPELRTRLVEFVDLGNEDWRRSHIDYLSRIQIVKDSLARNQGFSERLRSHLLTTPFLTPAQKELLVSSLSRQEPAKLSALEEVLARAHSKFAPELIRAVENGDMVAFDDLPGAMTAERLGRGKGLVSWTALYRASRYLALGTVEGAAEVFSSSDSQEDREFALDFLGFLIATGRDKVAVAMIEEANLGERWRPLREAVEAARTESGYLRRLAPEVRQPAKEILAVLEPVIQRFRGR